MSLGAARGLALLFFVAYTLALTWPGALPFNRIRPFVLGLPFSFFWVAVWVALGGVVLLLLDRAESRAAPDRDAPEGP